ncbi:protein disulfide-isomerase [Alcanivorax hongdengensis A-11-3]|uniref:Thiol:disulfide interchange protein n=1 Tax=Alcanivorax hongdengensis A-11-3 TaxID=1177179 RepID=L0WFJ5_9GAMM|nr:DsbC family protein [Alcanivorax hongdengensis]EKF75628.1 protein disulfide-isomerase [Alcanivorax hongdengensis A-11-3]
MKRWLFLALLGVITACSAQTDEASSGKTDKSAVIDKAAVEKAFADAFGNVKVTSVKAAPVPGMVEVEVNGRDTVYSTPDGHYVFTGDLLELKDGDVVNVAEAKFEKVRKAGIAKLDRSDMITFAAKDQKAEVFVFTDITCGYCRKLHRHIEAYNADGITVHYLAFPRGGPSSAAAQGMRHVWCAEDRAKALTDAKLNNSVSNNTLGDCADTVNQDYNLGVKFGVHGTPAIFTTDGKQLGGYLTPDQMKKSLDL